MVRRVSRSRGVSLVVVALVLLAGTAAPLVSPGGTARAQEDQPGPATQQLITAAVESGQIDYETSLVYRAYAVFGDDRLPKELVGAGAFEDASVFVEARLGWDSLSQSTRDLLTPFMVRPTDTRSIFAANPVGAQNETEQAPSAPEAADVTCSDGWASMGHPDYPLKIWIPCTGDYTGDLAKVTEMVELFWQPEVDLMGPPKPDSGGPDAGGDTRLDLYVVDQPTDLLPRNGGTEPPFEGPIIAMAISDSPIVGNTASGYMIAQRGLLAQSRFPLDLGHEFFHVLQYAHNVTITWGFTGTPAGEFEILRYTPYWFFEATPKWVESYVYRGKVRNSVLAATTHSFFVTTFSAHTDESLYTSPGPGAPQIYADYIYFLFLEQELGPDAIARIWRDLEPLEQDDFEGTLEVIDGILPFEKHFRDFAVRNLNLDLQPGDPIGPSYVDLDPSFPEGVRPVLAVGEGRDRVLEAQQDGEPARQIADTLKPLSARYYYLVPQDDVPGVALDFSGMTPTATLDVDLIVKIKDKGWERRQLPADATTTLCRDNPADDIEAFYLVLSNHSMDIQGALGGSFSLGTNAEACT